MSAAEQLSRLLKNVKAPDGNDRLARAMFLAQACAFTTPVDPSVSWGQTYEEKSKDFLKILNAVNENINVDTKLARGLYQQALRIRYELINGVTEPDIVQMALKSYTAELGQNQEHKAMTDWLVSRRDFAMVQAEAAQILTQVEGA